ncbi:MAG: bifunctional precorrin-2 dehydrogenase/sirohydrochlorin ferrochelatase [Anaerolineae bacterium]|jgi:siroheme synthase-like protein|nr:bifunctional precorrin-2 dehydrogenase/sirohydrochlorin ferrochelatase [Anaerolineae bacterium]
MAYPVLLQVTGRLVLIIGGGQVAARKARTLLTEGAQVIIVSPTLDPTLIDAPIVWRSEYYQAALLDELQPFLVFAATHCTHTNHQIAQDARHRHLWVDVVDDPSMSDFTNMATVQRGPITFAISTDGASPALTVHLRAQIEALFGTEYTILASWLAQLRPHIQQTLTDPADRQRLWHTIIASPILAQLGAGDQSAAQATLQRLLKEALP